MLQHHCLFHSYGFMIELHTLVIIVYCSDSIFIIRDYHNQWLRMEAFVRVWLLLFADRWRYRSYMILNHYGDTDVVQSTDSHWNSMEKSWPKAKMFSRESKNIQWLYGRSVWPYASCGLPSRFQMFAGFVILCWRLLHFQVFSLYHNHFYAAAVVMGLIFIHYS